MRLNVQFGFVYLHFSLRDTSVTLWAPCSPEHLMWHAWFGWQVSTKYGTWHGGHCEIYLRWHSLRASFRTLLHRADETQPSRNSCPRLQPYFIGFCHFGVSQSELFYVVKSAVQFVVCLFIFWLIRSFADPTHYRSRSFAYFTFIFCVVLNSLQFHKHLGMKICFFFLMLLNFDMTDITLQTLIWYLSFAKSPIDTLLWVGVWRHQSGMCVARKQWTLNLGMVREFVWIVSCPRPTPITTNKQSLN